MINSRTDVLQNAIRESCFEENENEIISGDKVETEEIIESSSANIYTIGPYYNEMSEVNAINPIDPALIQLQQYHSKSVTASNRKEPVKKFFRKLSRTSLKEVQKDKIEKSNNSNFYIGIHTDEDVENPPDANENENENLFDPIDKLKRVDDILFDRRNGLKRSESTLFYNLENQTETRTQEIDRNSNDSKALTMVVTHLVKWEKTYEFDCWIKDMFTEM